MPIYWTTRSIPGWSDLSKEDQKQIWRGSRWKVFGCWQTWVALGICGTCAALGSELGGTWGAAICGCTGGGFFGIVAGVIAHSCIKDKLESESSKTSENI